MTTSNNQTTKQTKKEFSYNLLGSKYIQAKMLTINRFKQLVLEISDEKSKNKITTLMDDFKSRNKMVHFKELEFNDENKLILNSKLHCWDEPNICDFLDYQQKRISMKLRIGEWVNLDDNSGGLCFKCDKILKKLD